MGRTVCAAVEGAEDMELAGRADPALGIALADAIHDARPDAVVDFSVPDAVFENAMLCLDHDVDVVVGTTGMTDDQMAELSGAAGRSSNQRRGNCFVAPN